MPEAIFREQISDRSIMLARILQKHPIWILVLVLSVTIYAAFQLADLKLVLDFSNYLPANSPELKFYNDYRDDFGTKDDFLTIGIYRSGGIFDSTFLHKINRFTDSCRALPFVSRVNSLTTLSQPVKSPFGMITRPLLRMDSTDVSARTRSRITSFPLLKDRFISNDETTTNVVLELDAARGLKESEILIISLDQLLSKFGFEETHIAGVTDIEVRYSWLSQQELRRFLVLSLLIIVVTLGIIYRSLWVILLSLAIFVLSLINLGGILVLANLELDMMAPMIPSIILIVSVSDAIHIFAWYSLPQNSRFTRVEAINQVAKTNFLTSMTTALGFFHAATLPGSNAVLFWVIRWHWCLIGLCFIHSIHPCSFIRIQDWPENPQGLFFQ